MAERTTDRDSKRFDPRFSPEFQPGFDPRVHREAPPAVNRQVATDEAPPSLIARVSRGGSVPSSDAQESASRADGAARDTAVDAETTDASPEVDETADADAAAPWWRRLNPYLVVLGLLGGAILLGALMLLQWAYESAGNPYTQQFDYLLMQFTMFGAPVMIALGIAILASVPLVLALRWRR